MIIVLIKIVRWLLLQYKTEQQSGPQYDYTHENGHVPS